MSDALKLLLSVSDDIAALWERLTLADPDAVATLKDLEAKKPGLVSEAKKSLRDAGPGTTKLGDYTFRVASGGTKKVYDIDEVVEMAGERDHLDDLLRYGVLEYHVNATQMERLPPELRVIYGELYTETENTLRVTIPRNLQ